MKKIFCFLLMFWCTSLYGQEGAPLFFSEVVPVDSVSADELFIRGRTWFATTYKDSKSVLQLAEDGHLIGKAMERFNLDGGFVLGTISVSVTYDILVECRDGRYQYIINNIVAKSQSGWANFGLLTVAENYKEQGSGAKTLNKLWRELHGLFNTYQVGLSASLKEAMRKTNRLILNDNW